jgi:hypothetical protein
MPKSVAEIKLFNKGIVSTPDAKDIPQDASDYSKDVETITSDGRLKGRKTETYASSIGGFNTDATGISNVTIRVKKLPSSGGGGG